LSMLSLAEAGVSYDGEHVGHIFPEIVPAELPNLPRETVLDKMYSRLVRIMVKNAWGKGSRYAVFPQNPEPDTDGFQIREVYGFRDKDQDYAIAIGVRDDEGVQTEEIRFGRGANNGEPLSLGSARRIFNQSHKTRLAARVSYANGVFTVACAPEFENWGPGLEPAREDGRRFENGNHPLIPLNRMAADVLGLENRGMAAWRGIRLKRQGWHARLRSRRAAYANK
jgi:hypothetical protein